MSYVIILLYVFPFFFLLHYYFISVFYFFLLFKGSSWMCLTSTIISYCSLQLLIPSTASTLNSFSFPEIQCLLLFHNFVTFLCYFLLSRLLGISLISSTFHIQSFIFISSTFSFFLELHFLPVHSPPCLLSSLSRMEFPFSFLIKLHQFSISQPKTAFHFLIHSLFPPPLKPCSLSFVLFLLYVVFLRPWFSKIFYPLQHDICKAPPPHSAIHSFEFVSNIPSCISLSLFSSASSVSVIFSKPSHLIKRQKNFNTDFSTSTFCLHFL